MAIYYSPVDVTNGDFITVEYWNNLFGVNGSLMYLYEEYLQKTRVYHLKLIKNETQNFQYSWVIPDLSSNIVTWDTAVTDYFPDDGKTLWDSALPNQVTIQETGFYNINVYLNLFNNTIATTDNMSAIYIHLIKQNTENEVITIGTDIFMNPISKNQTNTWPTYMNRMTNFCVSMNSIYYLENKDILYIKLQPSVAILGDSYTSFIGKYLTNIPTYYNSAYNKGTSLYPTTGTQYSFASPGYIGQIYSYFEIASVRLDN
jgi:hypothetical protein